MGGTRTDRAAHQPSQRGHHAGFSGVPAPGGLAGAWITCGTCQRPASTAAATMAMDSRLIRTLPWPMVCAARVASPGAGGYGAGEGRHRQPGPVGADAELLDGLGPLGPA